MFLDSDGFFVIVEQLVGASYHKWMHCINYTLLVSQKESMSFVVAVFCFFNGVSSRAQCLVINWITLNINSMESYIICLEGNGKMLGHIDIRQLLMFNVSLNESSSSLNVLPEYIYLKKEIDGTWCNEVNWFLAK